MTTFIDIGAEFLQFSTSVKGRVASVLFVEGEQLLRDFKERSPEDTGEYNANWRMLTSRGPGVLTGIVLQNKTSYGIYLDEGAEKNAAPWYYPGQSPRKSQKLTIRNGRVWAGGLNPGHEKTVFGATGPVLYDNNKRINQIAEKVADAVIGGLR